MVSVLKRRNFLEVWAVLYKLMRRFRAGRGKAGGPSGAGLTGLYRRVCVFFQRPRLQWL
jgi:hypothetical protein